jgi:hypothetical protein
MARTLMSFLSLALRSWRVRALPSSTAPHLHLQREHTGGFSMAGICLPAMVVMTHDAMREGAIQW